MLFRSLRLANGAQIPTMATVHAFDTEAEIATRPALEKTEVEKLFIKRKINRLYVRFLPACLFCYTTESVVN